MSHRLRVSTATQVEIIEDSLKVFSDLKKHMESCTVCDDDNLCSIGSEVYAHTQEAKRRLKVIGIE